MSSVVGGVVRPGLVDEVVWARSGGMGDWNQSGLVGDQGWLRTDVLNGVVRAQGWWQVSSSRPLGYGRAHSLTLFVKR